MNIKLVKENGVFSLQQQRPTCETVYYPFFETTDEEEAKFLKNLLTNTDPCPFCGDQPTEVSDELPIEDENKDTRYAIFCTHCGAESPGGRNIANAVWLWNGLKVK